MGNNEMPIVEGKTRMDPGDVFPRIIGIEWRSGRNTVGIVAVQSNAVAWSAYIGVAKTDYSPVLDARNIARWGCRLSENEARAFFPWVSDELFYAV